jgi:hypothetical protein
MHITINANRTVCIVLAIALGANAIGYLSQIVKPAFAQSDMSVGDKDIVACVFRNLGKIQNVQSTSDKDGSPLVWLRQVCQRNTAAQ